MPPKRRAATNQGTRARKEMPSEPDPTGVTRDPKRRAATNQTRARGKTPRKEMAPAPATTGVIRQDQSTEAANNSLDVGALTAQITASVTNAVMNNLKNNGLIPKDPVSVAMQGPVTAATNDQQQSTENVPGQSTSGPSVNVTTDTNTCTASSSMSMNARPPSGSFVSARLPMYYMVPQKVRERIWRDEFVELSTIMDDEATNFQLAVVNGAIVQRSLKSKRFMTIEQWTDAFNTYASVYRLKYPEATEGLAAYMELVRKISKLGGSWYYYDTNFRKLKRDANYSWNDRDDELFLVSLQKKQPARQPSHDQGASEPHPKGTANSSPGRHLSCKKFNFQEGCSGCDLPHICYHCGGSHPKLQCKRSNKSEKTGGKTTSQSSTASPAQSSSSPAGGRHT